MVLKHERGLLLHTCWWRQGYKGYRLMAGVPVWKGKLAAHVCACVHTASQAAQWQGTHLPIPERGAQSLGEIPWRREWQPTLNSPAWESPGTEEPGGLQPTGLQRVGHDRAHTCAYIQATPFIYVWADTTCQNWRGLRTELAYTFSDRKHRWGTFSKAKVVKDHFNEHAIKAKLKEKCMHSPILTKLICR